MRCCWSCRMRSPSRYQASQPPTRPARLSRSSSTRPRFVRDRRMRYHLRRAEYLEKSGEAELATSVQGRGRYASSPMARSTFSGSAWQIQTGLLETGEAALRRGTARAARPLLGPVLAGHLRSEPAARARPARPRSVCDRLPAAPPRGPLAVPAPRVRLVPVGCRLARFRGEGIPLSRCRGRLSRMPSTETRRPSFRSALLANRGLLRFHSGRQNEAIADLQEAIASNPRVMSAYVNMAQIRRHEHQLTRPSNCSTGPSHSSPTRRACTGRGPTGPSTARARPPTRANRRGPISRRRSPATCPAAASSPKTSPSEAPVPPR